MVVGIPSGGEFNIIAADFLESEINRISNEKDKVFIALSGGSTPIPILALLQERNLSWERLFFFMVDERTVAMNHPDSNYGSISKVFFDHIPSQSFSMVRDHWSIEDSLAAYEFDLKNVLNLDTNGFPVFDLIILGLGNDGHTASLFPHTLALKEENNIVVENEVPQLGTKRLTLTYPTLLSAKRIVVIIKGEEKRKIYDALVSEIPTDYPMQKIVSEHNDLNWIVEKHL